MTASPDAQEPPETQQFQVDLHGVVDLLGRHIYSGPHVYLRELLQNARDAIAARVEVEGTGTGAGTGWGGGRIRISPLGVGDGVSDDPEEFVLRDDGVGLTIDEVGDLLATVGRSSKRDIFDLPRRDFLGRFGIGLLSCFMVAETIVVRSRSARGCRAIEWIGEASGTFTARELEIGAGSAMPIGTSVHLRPRFDAAELLRSAQVSALAERFAEFLPVPVAIDLAAGGELTVTRPAPFLDDVPFDEKLRFGATLIGATPFDAIALEVPETGTRGAAYVLPYAPPPGAQAAHRVYLGRMLLGDRVDEVLPEWAFFVRAVIDSTGLNPTASRESLVDDAELARTRERLGASVRDWVLRLARTDPARLGHFVAIHELSLKSLVRFDEELARFIVPLLSLETSFGRLSVDWLTRNHSRIRYAETLDEYRQIVGIADPDVPLVNAGYVFDEELVRMLPRLFESVRVERSDPASEFARLDPAPTGDRATASELERRASRALGQVDCIAVVRRIDDPGIPAMHLVDAETLRAVDRARARDLGSRGPALWGEVLDRLDATIDGRGGGSGDAGARLCLNWGSPVVRALVAAPDGPAFERTVRLMYLQALLTSQRALAPADRALMTATLTELVQEGAAGPAATGGSPESPP